MSLHSNTLKDLVILTLENVMEENSLYRGTATGGSTTTVVDSSRFEADDYFANTNPRSWVRILSTTDGLAPVNEECPVTTFVRESGTASTGTAFSAAVGSGDTYGFFAKYRWEEVRGAINLAIDRANSYGALVDSLDESIVLASDVYEYQIPSSFIFLHSVFQANSSGIYEDRIAPTLWQILRGGAFSKLKLSSSVSISDGVNLRIEGYSKQGQLLVPTDLCYLDPEYIAHQTGAYLNSKRIRRTDVDVDAHAAQYQRCQAVANECLARMKPQFQPDTRRVG